MDLSAVVITYDSRAHIAACLRSLERARGALAVEVVVVDNASPDGTSEYVRRELPGTRVIDSGGNLGYSKAANIGIRATTGEFVLVLNPDSEIREGALETLVAWMRSHPRTGIAGPRLVGADGTPEHSGRTFPGPQTILFNRYSLLTKLLPDNPWSKRYLLADWDRNSSRSVDWLSGSCMCVRRAAIAQAGEMDEGYFMFNEDVDWCHAMKDAGWSVDYVADAAVMHRIGASHGRTSERVVRERHLGMIRYFRKYHSRNFLLVALVSIAVHARMQLMLYLNSRRPA